MLVGLKVRLRALLRKAEMDRELDEELRYHVERQAERYVAGGMDPGEARAAALRDLGNLERTKDEVRDARGVRLVEEALQDARFGGRMLAKSPTFTLIAVVVLALGIGANTAIFTLLDAVVLRPLAVSAPHELVLFSDATGEGTRTGDPGTGDWHYYSYPLYSYIREHTSAFRGLCAFRSGESRLSVRVQGSQSDTPERAQGHLVSGNYFDVLGIRATVGRALEASDDSPAAAPVAVVSSAYWKERLGGDASAVGSVVTLNGMPFTIVGVMPEGFFGVRVRRSPAFWIPLAFQPQVELRDAYLGRDDVYWLNLMGRLAPGATLESANAEADAALRQYLTALAGSELDQERLQAIQGSRVPLAPGNRGISGLRVNYTQPLFILMGVVVITLLIACANVGNLLLSRSLARRREILIRLALGARRGRIVKQLLTESVMLSALGGALGLFVAYWGTAALVALVAPNSPLDVAPNARVLGFTAGAALLCGLLFGLGPALHACSSAYSTGLKESGRGTPSGARSGLATALVVVQVALSLVLLVGAAMFTRSLLNLEAEDLGFRGENLLFVDVDSRIAGYRPAELTDLYRRVTDAVASVPGVQSVTTATYNPMSGSTRSSDVTVEGYAPEPDEDTTVTHLLVGPRYCETLGLPVLAGRDIGDRDTPGAPRVALVNQAFADSFFPGENPMGRRFAIGGELTVENAVEIVGVVGNAKFDDAREGPVRMAYLAMFQDQTQAAYACSVEVRTAGDPSAAAGAIRTEIGRTESRLPIVATTAFRQLLSDTLRQERLMASLVAAFGFLALVLACVGLYGVIAQSVARRTNEIGVRMALGATSGDILRLVLGGALAHVALGMAIGLIGALAAARLISSMLFGVGVLDPLSIAVAALAMFGTALVSGYIPARRATKVNPVEAIRYE